MEIRGALLNLLFQRISRLFQLRLDQLALVDFTQQGMPITGDAPDAVVGDKQRHDDQAQRLLMIDKIACEEFINPLFGVTVVVIDDAIALGQHALLGGQ